MVFSVKIIRGENEMTTETHPKEVDKEKQRMAGAISGGIFLISLGILLATGWWWPGIMVAIGLASGAALIFRGKTWQGIVSLAFFCGIAVVVEVVRRTDVDGVVVGAMILVGIGVIILLKALFFRE
jgi:hypothetical protein